MTVENIFKDVDRVSGTSGNKKIEHFFNGKLYISTLVHQEEKVQGEQFYFNKIMQLCL